MTIAFDPMAPFDAVLLATYGGPDGPNAVVPFMRNATKGKGIPDERLAEVGTHYERFGGVSPIIARNHELIDALQESLRDAGSIIPIYLGNRNWHPYFKDTLRRMIHAGHRRILMIPTAAYASYSGCRQYREDVWNARQELIDEGVAGAADLQVERAPLYYNIEGFIGANADAVARAWDELAKRQDVHPRIMFVTHSIPVGMQESSGLEGNDYIQQHMDAIEAVMQALPDRIRTLEPQWELTYCSRSGPPMAKWLEPDVNDAIAERAKQGVKSVIVAPVGFIQDHMEVVHDLDIEAAQTAAEAGVDYVRADTVGIDPQFVAGLRDLLFRRAQAARDGLDPRLTGLQWHDADPDTCCRQYPGAPVPQSISQSKTIDGDKMSTENSHGSKSAGHPHGAGHPQAGGHPHGAAHPHGAGHPHGGAHPHTSGHPHGGKDYPHPTGHQDGPADPRDHEVNPDEVNSKDHYFLFAVFKDLGGYDVASAQELAREVEDAISATGVEVRGFYNTEGFKKDADLMVWFYGDAADKVQAAYRALRQSSLGQYLEPHWNSMAAHIPAEFDARHLPACIAGAAPRDWIAVYPFVRSLDWYYLNPNRRRAMLREHGMNGSDFLDVKVSTLAAFALGDYEWMLALEADSLDRVMGVLRKQREVEARVYTRIDTPFYTGKRMDLADWIAR